MEQRNIQLRLSEVMGGISLSLQIDIGVEVLQSFPELEPMLLRPLNTEGEELHAPHSSAHLAPLLAAMPGLLTGLRQAVHQSLVQASCDLLEARLSEDRSYQVSPAVRRGSNPNGRRK